VIIKHSYQVSIITPLIVSNRFSRYFKNILTALATPPFYILYVQLSEVNSPISLKIQDSLRFHPFFDGALGAIDSTHIHCTSSAVDHDATRNCKSVLTQNCLHQQNVKMLDLS